MNKNPKTEIERLDLRSHDNASNKTAELLKLFPEIRTEGGRIDIDRLRRVLGETVDPGKERYGMNWPGKADCFKTIQQPSLATLRPCPKESVNFDTSENLIIEGDNLEVLKLLQKSYIGKIKMIYIDPPYNTGNDFIYPDNYAESLQTYLEYTNQIDSQGKRFSTNTDTDGRFHSKWLNMMYPRLYLARNLLRDDGIIFISIDENEVHNLRSILNEVFGEENIINAITVKTKESSGASGGGEDKKLKKNVETLFFVCKNINSFSRTEVFRREFLSDIIEEKKADGKNYEYRQVLLDVGSAKFIESVQDGSGESIEIFSNTEYKITSVDKIAEHDGISVDEAYAKYHTKIFRTTNAQTSIRARVNEVVGGKEGLFSIRYTPRSGKNKGEVTTKYFSGPSTDLVVWLSDTSLVEDGRVVKLGKAGTLWDDLAWTGIAKEGGVEFENGKKPVAFVRRMLDMATTEDSDSIVLDFFAGSGTTAHAVLEKNFEDKGQRRFILVQLPEPTRTQKSDGSWSETTAWRAGYKTIADITKDRVRKVVSKMKTTTQTLTGINDAKEDLGYRVFKLDESCFKPWRADTGSGPSDEASLAKQLEFHVTHILEGRDQEDILFEILLKCGFPLPTKVEKITISGKVVYSIAAGAMLLCLEDALTHELLKGIAERKPERVICLDEGFAGNDQLKTNAVQAMKVCGVTSFKTV